MRIFGFEISRADQKAANGLQMADTRRSGPWGWITEPFTGAWQSNVEVRLDDVLASPAVFRCIGLPASDIGKMRMRLVKRDENGIWTEAANNAYSPVLARPNRYQNRIQFFSNWVESKMTQGNTVVLKQRDGRGIVTALYILNWCRVKPLVAPDGSVFYELGCDPLSQLTEESVVVPASEIIHDRWNTLYHPLVGLSPIFACGVAAVQGLRIQQNSAVFFGNNSTPNGILTAPGAIDQETATRLQTKWQENYGGKNRGKVAVLGQGLEYKAITINAVDAQLIEQLKWTAETVASVFGIPAYKIGAGEMPTANNVEALDQQYYSQCLQIHIESIELCLDEGLGLKAPYGTEFDLDDLLRMDSATLMTAMAEGVKGGILKPDEARRRVNLSPVTGGDQVYLQQQNFSLAALAKRDAQDDPFKSGNAPAAAAVPLKATAASLTANKIQSKCAGAYKRAA